MLLSTTLKSSPRVRKLAQVCLRCQNQARYTSKAQGLQVFNELVKNQQRDRAASSTEISRNVDYLRDEVASRLCDRLHDIKRSFPRVLDMGANSCNIARYLTSFSSEPVSRRIGEATEQASSPQNGEAESTSPPIRFDHITSADSCEQLLYRDKDLPFNSRIADIHERVVLPPSQDADLPFAAQSFDAVLSSLSMHWINDLPGHLSRIARVLKPDSPFIGAMLGGDSLFELRTSMQLADLDRRGGVGTHVSPLADVRDIGGLLTRAGFKMLTVDVDDIIVEYPSSYALMTDLQAMGESNAALTRELSGLRRDVLLATEAIYRELHARDDQPRSGRGEIGESRPGSIPATFRIIYMIGWTPGEGQREPERRGSGQVNLADVLGGEGGDPGSKSSHVEGAEKWTQHKM